MSTTQEKSETNAASTAAAPATAVIPKSIMDALEEDDEFEEFESEQWSKDDTTAVVLQKQIPTYQQQWMDNWDDDMDDDFTKNLRAALTKE